MSNEVAERQRVSLDIQEKVLIGGDLSKLTIPERLSYYNNLCESLGLNPLTSPFEYITLNGKLRLYAKKDCTDQLRRVHGVSVLPNSTRIMQVEDVRVVVVSVQDKTGRTDEGTGAVPIAGLKGEALANAIMKCETKAKRRATLSICGLGMLDETELETIPKVAVIPQVRPRNDATMVRPATDKYTGEPIKQEEDVDVPHEADTTVSSQTPASNVPPPAPLSAADYCKQRADETDTPSAVGIIGNYQPYSGKKRGEKGLKPGLFDLEDGQGGIIMHGIRYFDPDLDLSSGLKRVYYHTQSYKGQTQYIADRIESAE